MYFIKSKVESIYKKVTHNRINPKRIAGRKILSADEVNKLIYDKILHGQSLFVGRYGASEMNIITEYIKSRRMNRDIDVNSVIVKNLVMLSGFFPNKLSEIEKFAQLMLQSGENVDILGRWWNGFEDYVIKHYAKDAMLTDLLYLEPWFPGVKVPWTLALKGKRILVIHPFNNTIEKQYKKRLLLFSDKKILPEFELITLQAVQTAAGLSDNRFKTWFDALDYMFNESMKTDFDIAIVGCGAYGFPLAQKIKNVGKQAIHLGGATQLLFGIKGRRWEENDEFQYIRKLFNENWVYPNKEETPISANKIENSCYWR